MISFLIAAGAGMIVTVPLGLLDGTARVLNYPALRIVIAVLLVLLTWYWITMMGYMGLDTTDFYGRQVEVPSIDTYFGVLAGMEFALITEWVIAVMIPSAVALVRSWLRV